MVASRAAIEGAEGNAAGVLLTSIDGPVATLRLNRPHVHNALDDELLLALEAELVRLDRADAVRALVLTGEGRSFSSGDDLKGLRDASDEAFAHSIDALQRVTARLFRMGKPVICAFNGPAYGAGLELALACDVRLAVPGFVCATPEVRLGLVATNGASLLLPLLIGQSQARRMLFSGGNRKADWCLEVGLVEEIVPSERLLARAAEMALEMCAGAPEANAATRRLLNGPLEALFSEVLEAEAAACIAARRSAEGYEGIAAYFAKRRPKWQP